MEGNSAHISRTEKVDHIIEGASKGFDVESSHKRELRDYYRDHKSEKYNRRLRRQPNTLQFSDEQKKVAARLYEIRRILGIEQCDRLDSRKSSVIEHQGHPSRRKILKSLADGGIIEVHAKQMGFSKTGHYMSIKYPDGVVVDMGMSYPKIIQEMERDGLIASDGPYRDMHRNDINTDYWYTYEITEKGAELVDQRKSRQNANK